MFKIYVTNIPNNNKLNTICLTDFFSTLLHKYGNEYKYSLSDRFNLK